MPDRHYAADLALSWLMGKPDPLTWALQFRIYLSTQADNGITVEVGDLLPWFNAAIQTGRLTGARMCSDDECVCADCINEAIEKVREGILDA